MLFTPQRNTQRKKYAIANSNDLATAILGINSTNAELKNRYNYVINRHITISHAHTHGVHLREILLNILRNFKDGTIDGRVEYKAGAIEKLLSYVVFKNNQMIEGWSVDLREHMIAGDLSFCTNAYALLVWIRL